MNTQNQKRISRILVVLALGLFTLSMFLTREDGVWMFGPDSVTAATGRGGRNKVRNGGRRGNNRNNIGIRRGGGRGADKNNTGKDVPAISPSDANTSITYDGPVKSTPSSKESTYVPQELPVNTAGSLEGKAIARVNDDGILMVLPKEKSDPGKEAVKVQTNPETIVVIDSIEAQLDRLKPDMQLIITTDSGKAIKIVAFSPVQTP